jgi:hypothetical protein
MMRAPTSAMAAESPSIQSPARLSIERSFVSQKKEAIFCFKTAQQYDNLREASTSIFADVGSR